MQNSDFLRQYAVFNIWANKKMAAWLENVAPGIFEAEIENSFPSLKKTVLHIWGAEYLWHKRLNGESPAAFPGASPTDAAVEVFAKLIQSSEDLRDVLEGKDEGWFGGKFDYKNLAGTEFTSARRDVIQHVINHSTYHRGQLLTMGRQLGIPNPPSTDFILWTRER